MIGIQSPKAIKRMNEYREFRKAHKGMKRAEMKEAWKQAKAHSALPVGTTIQEMPATPAMPEMPVGTTIQELPEMPENPAGTILTTPEIDAIIEEVRGSSLIGGAIMSLINRVARRTLHRSKSRKHPAVVRKPRKQRKQAGAIGGTAIGGCMLTREQLLETLKNM